MNDRAKRRLELARGILAIDPNAQPDAILAAIKAKESSEQDKLRSAVDWLEDYEAHECEFLWGK